MPEIETSFLSLRFGENSGYTEYAPAQQDEKNIHLYIQPRAKSACCPCCGAESTDRYATYVRDLQDTPIAGKKVTLHLRLGKYRCTNPDCSQDCFVESTTLACRSSRLTYALESVIYALAICMSSNMTSFVLSLIGIFVSGDTIIRMIERIKAEDDPDVTEIGVDDVANRKGVDYLTVVYDLHDHHLLALLDGRDGKTFEEWLKQHPKVTKVCRDRASAYASAITHVLGNIVQIADRFHLFQNAIDWLKKIFYKMDIPKEILIVNGEIPEVPPEKVKKERKFDDDRIKDADYNNSPPVDEDGNLINYSSTSRNLNTAAYKARAEKRLEKQAKILNVQEYIKANPDTPLKEVAVHFSLSTQTIRKYRDMTAEEIKALSGPPSSRHHKNRKGDAYVNIVYKMMKDGHDDEEIYHYLRSIGITDNISVIFNYLNAISAENFPDRRRMRYTDILEETYPEGVTVIKRSQVLKYILTTNEKTPKSKTVDQYYDLIKEKYPDVEWIREAFTSFHEIIMGDDPDKLDDFLQKYGDTALKPFCDGIKKDIAPVKNAISFSESSGFVEGNNSRFKTIKRILGGRSKLVNLRARCILAFYFTLDDFDLTKMVKERVIG